MGKTVVIHFDNDNDADRLFEAAGGGYSFDFNTLGGLDDKDEWLPSYKLSMTTDLRKVDN